MSIENHGIYVAHAYFSQWSSDASSLIGGAPTADFLELEIFVNAKQFIQHYFSSTPTEQSVELKTIVDSSEESESVVQKSLAQESDFIKAFQNWLADSFIGDAFVFSLLLFTASPWTPVCLDMSRLSPD